MILYTKYYLYHIDYIYSFDEEKPGFFSQTVSIAVVHFILERMRFSDDDETSNNIGIEKLLAESVYEAAYPLHDVGYREQLTVGTNIFIIKVIFNFFINILGRLSDTGQCEALAVY